MGRTPSSKQTGDENAKAVKKGVWSAEEDRKLMDYIRRYGIWNWTHMPTAAGLSRSGKSCRLRWLNYLRPNIKHGNFSKEEEETIIKWQNLLGNKWSAIAGKLPGRTDNEIKNFWNTRVKKRGRTKNSGHQPAVAVSTPNTTPISSNIHGHPSILESSSHPSISRASESEETSKNKVGDSDDVSSGVFPEAVEVDQLWEKIILSDPLQDAFMEDEFETMFMASSCWFDLPASMNYSPVESSYDGYDLEYDNLWEN